ncbi:MAG: VWA domain-containing protein, partial [Planctomycetota bacterium]
MSFLNLWAAALLAAIVIPALLILYFLKLRRREEVVPSTLLWKRTVQDLQVNAPFQRLRKNLLLFLQLLVLAAALLALARPIVQTSVADAARVVLLIDNSASMNAKEGERTRLAEAKEQAKRLTRTFNRSKSGWRSLFALGSKQAETQVMVIAFSDRANIVSPFTTNTAELADLIDRIEPTDRRTDLREALSLAEAYMAPPTRLTSEMEGPSGTPASAETPAKLVLVSDGRVANLDKVVLRSGTMDLLKIGKAEDNAGITVLRSQRNYERPESVEVFMTVRNFGPQPVETDVSLYVDGVLRTARPIKLAGRPPPKPEGPTTAPAVSPEPESGSVQSLSFALELDRAAVIEARLSRDDALAADNSAVTVLPPPRRQRVLVVTEGQFPFLDAVTSRLPLEKRPFVTPAQYEAGAEGPHESDGQSTWDLVIFDKYVPEKLPAGNFLYLGALPKVAAIEG